jgi:hypothetical protein
MLMNSEETEERIMSSEIGKWAYVAGIVDGEGCIQIFSRPSKTAYGTPYPGYRCEITIANTRIVLMKWLVQHFGGTYRQKSNGSHQNPKHKICYEWRLGSHAKKERFLLGILPYLLIKREQGLLSLEFVRLGRQPNAQKREELMQKCRPLNRRGFSPETDTQDNSEIELKIQSELTGDCESELAETLVS